MDYTVHGILQARILEWVAFPFSREGSSPQGWIFPTQGMNPGLPHCRQIRYQLSHKRSPAGRFFTTEPPTKLSVRYVYEVHAYSYIC